jgi:hypothetical protein
MKESLPGQSVRESARLEFLVCSSEAVASLRFQFYVLSLYACHSVGTVNAALSRAERKHSTFGVGN